MQNLNTTRNVVLLFPCCKEKNVSKENGESPQ